MSDRHENQLPGIAASALRLVHGRSDRSQFGTATHHSCKNLQQIRIVIQFHAVRSLSTPRPSDASWWGGLRAPGAPYQASEGDLLRQRCDARSFTPLRIEIIARQKVAPAFEPQKVSGRMTPASECNAMDASGPAALACCACSQHEACGDYSNSHVV